MLITRRQDADLRRAWDELVATLTSAGETTVEQAKGLFGDAQETVSDSGREARRRMHNAAGALAGRPTPPRWGLIAVAGVVGAAVGAAAIIAATQFFLRPRKAITADEEILGSEEILSPDERDRIVAMPQR